MVLFIVVGANILGNAISMLKIPAELSHWIIGSGVSPMIVWMFIVLMYLGMGCLIDGLSMMVLTLPVTFPLLVSLGFDPVWFGVTLVLLCECGLITPPVGINLYIIHGIAGRGRFEDVVIGAMPFFLIMLVAIILFTAFPSIITWLPSTAGGG